MRYRKLDGLRGLTIISMVAYHLLWDMNFIFGAGMAWYSAAPGYIWQQSICWSFILLSGFCASLASERRLSGLLRGLEIFGAGALVTLATVLFMPQDRIIFGVLTLVGSCKLLEWALHPLLKKPHPAAGTAVSLALFVVTRHVADGFIGIPADPHLILAENILPEALSGSGTLPGLTLRLPAALYSNYLSAFFGFPFNGFYSTDYFSLIPWIFLYMAGFYLQLLGSGSRAAKMLEDGLSRPLEWLGRKSFIIYLLHQPLIYALLYLFYNISFSS